MTTIDKAPLSDRLMTLAGLVQLSGQHPTANALAEASERIVELERRSADLLAANNRYLMRARDAEAERDALSAKLAAKEQELFQTRKFWSDASDNDLAQLHSADAEIARLKAEGETATPDSRGAARYQWLRSRDLDTIETGGIFIGRVPENLVLNGDEADAVIDAAMKGEANG